MLLVLVALAVLQEPDLEAQAAEQVAKAEEQARNGRYADARTTYERAAKRFASTKAGALAAQRSAPSAFLGWADVVRHGPSKNRVDVVLMGDGYELEHLRAFDKLAEDIPPLYERQETFREYYRYFNFQRAILLSAENGVDGFGREYDTALNASTGNTFAGHVVIDRAKVDEVFAQMPDHDLQAIVFVRNGVLGTGGSGVATIGGREVTTVIHEFGHSFGGLSDEYSSQQSAHQGSVRDGINVSATDDPKKVPWKHWLEAKHPSIGIYEGAAARERGAWKPTASGCTMSSGEAFCPVCREALVLKIYRYVDPIDAVEPLPQRFREKVPYVVEKEPLELRVEVLRPATHVLEARWWVLPEVKFPSSGGSFGKRGETGGAGPADRSRRGPLEAITDAPVRTVIADTNGVHTLKISSQDYEPGIYRVICRIKDTTKLRGERFPWVLKDDEGLLESERGWWVEIKR